MSEAKNHVWSLKVSAGWEPHLDFESVNRLRATSGLLKVSADWEPHLNFESASRCNAPKYTLVVFDMFRVFCRHKLKFS